MDYRVLVASDNYQNIAAEKLEAKVNIWIKQGWKPLGGVSVSRSDYSSFVRIVMAQAMIKE